MINQVLLLFGILCYIPLETKRILRHPSMGYHSVKQKDCMASNKRIAWRQTIGLHGVKQKDTTMSNKWLPQCQTNGYQRVKQMDTTTSNKWIQQRQTNWYHGVKQKDTCLLYTSPSPRDLSTSRMPSSAWKNFCLKQQWMR